MDWENSIQIDTDIESVWKVLTDVSYLKTIKPQVVESKLIETSEDGTVQIYEETYQEGKRQETYMLTITTLENNSENKKQTFHFVIAKMIESNGYFSLHKQSDDKTLFTYSGKNEGIGFMGKTMMKMAKTFDKGDVVTDFLKKVKETAEAL